MKTKLKKRYVLASGYLWHGHDDYQIQVFNKRTLGLAIRLRNKFPEALFSLEAPKYRLVLERVK
jgi:hypothetical protein